MNRIFLIIFLFCFQTTFAQSCEYTPADSEKRFNDMIRQLHIKYRTPANYIRICSTYNAHMGPVILSVSDHQLQSKKDSIYIYVEMLDIDTTQATYLKLKKWGLYADVNKNYLKLPTDTIKFPVKHHTKQYTKRIYHADHSGEIELAAPKKYPLKGVYNQCKAVFVHKENQADFAIYYFYNESSAKQADRHMKRTRKILRFIE